MIQIYLLINFKFLVIRKNLSNLSEVGYQSVYNLQPYLLFIKMKKHPHQVERPANNYLLTFHNQLFLHHHIHKPLQALISHHNIHF